MMMMMMTTTMRRRPSLLVSLGWLLSMAIASAATATETTSTTTTTTTNAVIASPNNHNHADARNLAIYALYNVPPFAVTFSTKPTDELQSAVEESAALLSETGDRDSSLSYPIRTVTETFLLQRFDMEIADLQTAQSKRFRSIYDHLVAVDLQTKLYLSQFDEESSVRRRQRRGLQTEVTLVAEMYGTVAFLEPEDKSTKPSNEEVRALFGEWIHEIFSEHRDAYLRELVQSEQELLREISTLEIETNIDQGSPSKSAYVEGWSTRTEKALLTMLILLGIMGLVWMVLYLRQRHKHKMLASYEEDYGEQGDILSNKSFDSLPRPQTITGRERQSSMDAVRHGADTFHRSSQTGAMSILESTDRYLSKHRPDLYRQESGGSAEISVFGRSYAIPANPFEAIYSSFSDSQHQPSDQFHSPRGAFTPRGSEGRRNSLEIQKENIAFVQEHLEDDYEGDHVNRANRQSGGYRPIASIWRNLSGMWEDVKTQQNQQQTDGLVYYSQEQPSENEMEDPEDYDFAFKDFPRHDGTPCLIFDNDGKDEHKQRIFIIGSNDEDDDYLDNQEVATTPVSDSAFQRMLSQHSLNSSMEEVFLEDPPIKSPEFKEKLDRLVQQKKRQYEKKAIIEKHQEQRAKERKQIREQERRERHKVMEAEIESIEATFKSPLERSRAMQMSPKVRRSYSPKRATAHFSPKRSPMRAKQVYRDAFSPHKNDYDMPMKSTYDTSIKSSNSWADGDRTSQSPAYRPSSAYSPKDRTGVFRPPPKTSYLPSDNPDASSRSSRSISPPGGIEDASEFSLRPRTTRPNPDLHVNTLYGNNSMDSKTMDKLSMPPMIIGGPPGSNPKYPSPNSVMDEIMFAPTKQQPPKHSSHRRVNSYSHAEDDTSSRGSHLPPRKAKANSNNHRRSNSGHHRRSGSNASASSDVFVHGIFAQTRFV